MKNNINKKIGATLLTAAIMAGTAVIPMSNAAVEAAAEANKPSIKYQAHVQNEGWMDWAKDGETAGTFYKSQRMEALKISLENCENVTLNIKAHIQDYGDREFTVTAADADKLIGTQYEAKRMEAITITTEGLKEQGYKLQYRAHVQDIGWQDWADEGEMAGTKYEAKRIEAIEMRLVVDEEAMAAKELAEAKISSIDTLTKYDAALSTYLSSEDYKTATKKIEEAMKSINNAEDLETVNEIFDATVATIKTYNSKIEELSQKVEEDKNAAQETALKEIEAYKEALASVTDLAENDRNIINTFIANATDEVVNAKTATKVNAAIGSLNSLMNTKYSKVVDAKNLKKAQSDAYAKLDVYEDFLNNTNAVAEDKKDIVRNAINNTRKQVETAKKAEDITKVDGIMAKFETYMSTYYKELIDAVLQETVDNAIETLDTYLEYSDTDEKTFVDIEGDKKIKAEYRTVADLSEFELAEYLYGDTVKVEAEKAIGEINTLAKNPSTKPADIEQKLNETVEKLNKKIAIIKTISDATLQKQQEDYEKANKEAMAELDEYVANIGQLELTDSQRNNINSMIENTRTKIRIATKDSEVTAAMSIFNAYIDAYYPEVKADVKDAILKQTRIDAIAKLTEYAKSENATVKAAAESALSTVRTATETADIKNEVESVENTIKAEELKAARTAAKEELWAYIGKGNDEPTKNAVNVAVTTGVSKINSATIDKIEEEKQKALEEISAILKEEIKSAQEKLEEKRTEALKTVQNYKEVAADCNSTLVNDMASYESAIKTATTESAIDELINDLKARIAADTLLQTKLTKIETLESKIEGYDLESNIDFKYIRAIADKAIADMKVADTTDKVSTIEVKAETDCDAVKDEIVALNGKKTTAISHLKTFANSDTELLDYLKTYEAKINAVSIKDKTTDTTINSLEAECKENMLNIKKAAALQVINDYRSDERYNENDDKATIEAAIEAINGINVSTENAIATVASTLEAQESAINTQLDK